MPSITQPLLELDLFKDLKNVAALEEQVTLQYHRAQTIARSYGRSLPGKTRQLLYEVAV
jgi:hypothetical protein